MSFRDIHLDLYNIPIAGWKLSKARLRTRLFADTCNRVSKKEASPELYRPRDASIKWLVPCFLVTEGHVGRIEVVPSGQTFKIPTW